MKNFLLSQLSEEGFKQLEPHLKIALFKQRSVLFEADGEIEHVYFPVGAVVSLVVTLASGEMIEAARVGSEGVVGAFAALDGRISLSRGVIQVPGYIVICKIDGLKSAALQNPKLLSLLIRHEQAVYAEVQQSVACFAAHPIEARFCRWLLRARDLTGTDTLLFTQEYLAEITGIGRTSVALISRTLQSAGLIRYARGEIHIVDAEALKTVACECYETIKRRHDRLLISAK